MALDCYRGAASGPFLSSLWNDSPCSWRSPSLSPGSLPSVRCTTPHLTRRGGYGEEWGREYIWSCVLSWIVDVKKHKPSSRGSESEASVTQCNINKSLQDYLISKHEVTTDQVLSSNGTTAHCFDWHFSRHRPNVLMDSGQSLLRWALMELKPEQH